MQNYQSTPLQHQTHHRSYTPTSQYPNQQSRSSQQPIQTQQQQLPQQRTSNPNAQQNHSSFTSNRLATNPESYSANRQMSERQQYSVPQPQYIQGVRNQSRENKENYESSSQQVQTLPNYSTNKHTNITQHNYPPQIHSQQNLHTQSKENQNTNNINNQNNSTQQPQQNSRPLASPHNWHLVNQQQQQNINPPSARNGAEQLKVQVQEQLEEFKVELMKNFQNVVQECLQKNQISSNSIENLKKQIGNNKLDIKEMNTKMEDINLRIDEVRNQQYNGEINEEYLEREVQSTIKNLYEDKIENIENEQNEIKSMLENLKDQLIKEIAEQMSSIGSAIQAKAQEEDEIIYQNISDIKHDWEKKLNHVFEQMNKKINSIEQNLENFKREKAIPKIENMQNEIYSKFDENIKRYESQLMHVKAQIDSKLDRSQISEVIQGYKNIKETEIFNQIGYEVESLKRQMLENASDVIFIQFLQILLTQWKQNKVERNTHEFEDRIKKFEQFVESRLRDYNQKIQDKFENNNQVDNQVQQQELMLQQFDEQILQLNQQYECFQQELKQYGTNVYELKTLSDEKFQKLVKDLNHLENAMNSNNSKVQKDLSLSHQYMDDKVENLNKEMQILLTQMSAFQNNLDENIQQYSQKISIEQQQNQKILDQIQQKQQVSPSIQLSQQKINQSSNFQDPVNQIIDGRDSQLSTKYDDYLKKYEDFNKEVSSYLTKRDIDDYDNEYEKHSSPNFDGGYKNIQDDYNQQEMKKVQKNIKMSAEKNNRRGFQDNENDEEEEEVVYELDDEGYLIDEKGKQIQLSKEHIEYLKTNDMLQDD